MKKIFPIIALISICLPFALSAHADTTNVAVAANFTAAAKDIEKAFKSATGHDVVLSFGSTGKLYAQIIKGAPFDAILAADAARPIKLEADGQAVANTRFTFAFGQIVLWSPQDGVDVRSLLSTGNYNKLAIANPKTAPYGAAAQEALEKMNLMKMAQGKLVQGDSIAQTHQFVSTGAADLGFVALAQVALDGSGSKWAVPSDLYAPIAQQAILLNKGTNNPATIAFLDFLKSSEAITIIKSYGYGVEN
ncbi:molybdate ABC transporter substrate-binding protein [Magnetovibrio blakemorei]|uniref:Molybdate ABC transporter substrate-binding protein n=1 Tax=Magnetovibrio blakemorei TaxID=28181 RepID=A0A1E5Q7A0_9PROT|nr:molybdate ABC transporter substrate-binding protein [Magnetovibrio blakemorei]OEJ66942.1 molybdate ABC transporter substrate-binding protein [Magnetovibrio blakemorei]